MLWQLFISFLKIGAFTFGGGYAMVPLIEREVIDKKGWVRREDFLDLLTLAQSAPGPIALNTAVFVGYRISGLKGALSALMGIVLPSFTIILLVALFFADIRDNVVVDAAFKAMRPAVVALIVAPIVGLAKGMNHWLWIVAGVTALLIWYFGVSPVYVLVAGAAAGLLWTIYTIERGGKQ
ncbi:MAG: chromate transporter [Alistipes sp.]|nr:chromate transporter [Alistipes sp.]MBQ9963092.1 chromate transporter [Alistipes sp.]